METRYFLYEIIYSELFELISKKIIAICKSKDGAKEYIQNCLDKKKLVFKRNRNWMLLDKCTLEPNKYYIKCEYIIEDFQSDL